MRTKYFIILLFCGFAGHALKAQNVGINTITPLARLHVKEGNVVFSANGDTLVSRPYFHFTDTSRINLWYPSKAAFRTGRIDSGFINTTGIGTYSFGAGWCPKATELYATAFGVGSSATANGTIASGYFTEATEKNAGAFGDKGKTHSVNSFVSGYECQAVDYSVAMGYQSYAADYSAAFGSSAAAHSYTAAFGISHAEQQYGTSFGRLCVVGGNGLSATAFNYYTYTDGNYVVCMGDSTWSNSYASWVMGRNNKRFETSATHSWVTSDPVMIVGSGTSNTVRTDLFELFKNGNLTITGTLTQSSDEYLKKDITPLRSSLKKINSLTGYNYNWKSKLVTDKKQCGLIAQEVEKQLPELVTSSDGNIKGVNYGGMIPYLIEVIKELKKQTDDADELAAEYELRKAHYYELEKRVIVIEKAVKIK